MQDVKLKMQQQVRPATGELDSVDGYALALTRDANGVPSSGWYLGSHQECKKTRL
jgi:hypothetical protein